IIILMNKCFVLKNFSPLQCKNILSAKPKASKPNSTAMIFTALVICDRISADYALLSCQGNFTFTEGVLISQ
ncbi:MAG: hypothetical protein IJF90_12525, partial [Synergistaceae bacterium]|nr:hypothetical protein [Synergistaceae bacterium]